MHVEWRAATSNSTENNLIQLSVRLTKKKRSKKTAYRKHTQIEENFSKLVFYLVWCLLYMLLGWVCRRTMIKEKANKKEGLSLQLALRVNCSSFLLYSHYHYMALLPHRACAQFMFLHFLTTLAKLLKSWKIYWKKSSYFGKSLKEFSIILKKCFPSMSFKRLDFDNYKIHTHTIISAIVEI